MSATATQGKLHLSAGLNRVGIPQWAAELIAKYDPAVHGWPLDDQEV